MPLILVASLVIALGLAMIAYPFASDYLNRREQAKVTQDLEHVTNETPAEDLSAQMERAVDYNERLVSGSAYVVDPFDPDAPKTSDEEYVSLLNLAGNGVMGSIAIPRIGVDLPIYHGVEGEGMMHAVGHVPNSSLPVGGPSTHSVLAGHTGLPSAVIFDALDKLGVGDYFVIRVLGEEHAYRVTSTEVVLPDDASSLGIRDGEDLVTLVTCTPYGVNSHRLLVHAERCDVPQDWVDRKTGGQLGEVPLLARQAAQVPPVAVGLAFALALLLVAYGAWRLLRRMRR